MKKVLDVASFKNNLVLTIQTLSDETSREQKLGDIQ